MTATAATSALEADATIGFRLPKRLLVKELASEGAVETPGSAVNRGQHGQIHRQTIRHQRARELPGRHSETRTIHRVPDLSNPTLAGLAASRRGVAVWGQPRSSVGLKPPPPLPGTIQPLVRPGEQPRLYPGAQAEAKKPADQGTVETPGLAVSRGRYGVGAQMRDAAPWQALGLSRPWALQPRPGGLRDSLEPKRTRSPPAPTARNSAPPGRAADAVQPVQLTPDKDTPDRRGRHPPRALRRAAAISPLRNAGRLQRAKGLVSGSIGELQKARPRAHATKALADPGNCYRLYHQSTMGFNQNLDHREGAR